MAKSHLIGIGVRATRNLISGWYVTSGSNVRCNGHQGNRLWKSNWKLRFSASIAVVWNIREMEAYVTFMIQPDLAICELLKNLFCVWDFCRAVMHKLRIYRKKQILTNFGVFLLTAVSAFYSLCLCQYSCS